MLKLAAVTLLFSAVATAAQAQYRPFETVNDARQRQNAERYETYRSNGYQAPLGGYQERLGDPAPRGTESPGYVTPPSYDRSRRAEPQGFERDGNPSNSGGYLVPGTSRRHPY